MGKRIGSFISPVTGEEDWLEPDTINMVILQPRMVTKVGDVNRTSINFRLDCTDDEENITVIAEYTDNGNKYSSKAILIPSIDFAEEFKNVIYLDKSLEDSELIKSKCDEACQDLTVRLMDNNILMGGMQFSGIGFVFVDDDKVLSIESVDFNYEVVGGERNYSAVLHNCVGQALLQNLENPYIKFWNGNYEVSLIRPTVTENTEGRVKDYTLNLEGIEVTPNTTMPEFSIFKEYNFFDESFLDKFIEDRRSLLDDMLGNDSDLDDRFDFLDL